MRSLEKTLALWVAGLLESDQVVEWAGRRIAELDKPPYELIELVAYGPDSCLKRAKADFAPRPSPMTYEEGFALRAVVVNLDEVSSVAMFADWVAGHCIGEELDHPYVILGYQLDHLIDDCRDEQAVVELVRSKLPDLLPACRQIASSYADDEA